MALMIKNDWDSFSPIESTEWGVIALVVPGFFGGIASVIASACMFFAGGIMWAPLLLLIWTLLPICAMLETGNVAKRLGCEKTTGSGRYGYSHSQTFETNRYKLWKTYKGLPGEVQSKVGKLSVDDIAEMSDETAGQLRDKMFALRDAYWENQKALVAPKVIGIIHNVEDATNAYRESTKTVKELI